MEVLTGDTLAEALLFCSQQENVSVCVVLDNMRNTKELVETLWREIELGNLPGWVMQRGFDVASFSNTYSILNTKKSSAMYFITAYDTQNFKGRTFNRILYLSDLNTVILSEFPRKLVCSNIYRIHFCGSVLKHTVCKSSSRSPDIHTGFIF